MNEAVVYERHDAVAWVTLNRPHKLNAINQEMRAGLRTAIDRASEDDEVKAVVLTGAGRAFSAGYDISEAQAADIESPDKWYEWLAADLELTMRLWGLPKPTIALVRGWCLAGACELAMACDLIIAGEDGRFGEPEIRWGAGPGTLLMPFLIGQKKTNELLLTGDVIEAREAHRLGLVNHVVPSNQLEAKVEEVLAKLTPTPLPVLRLTKLAILRAYEAMGLGPTVQANLSLSTILHASETPEGREFFRIVAERGLKAALAWRDERYGQGLA